MNKKDKNKTILTYFSQIQAEMPHFLRIIVP